MKGNSQKKTQVKVCYICGDKGFSNALIDCSKCPNTFAHQYCMGIPPGSIDSSFTWVCEYCCEPAKHQPCISTMPGDVSATRKMKAIASLYSESCTNKGMGNKHKRKRDSLGLDTEALSTSRSRYKVKRLKHRSLSARKYDRGEDIATNKPAKGCTRKGKGNKHKRKRDSINPDTETLSTSRSRYKVKRLKDRSFSTNRYDRGEDIATNKPAKVEAKSKSGSSPKVRGHRNNNVRIRNEKGQFKCATNGESPTDPDNWKLVLLEEQPKPLLILMPIEYKGSSEHAETSYGSWEPTSSVMDCPKEIMRGVVLLVSPLGEIYIESASFTDDPYPASLATAILHLTNGYCDISSNDLVVNNHEQTSLNDIIEETEVLDEPSLCTDEVGGCSDMQDLGQKISEVPDEDSMLMGH